MFSLCRCHNRQYGITVIRFGFKELALAARDILFPLRCLACGAGLQGDQEISYCQTCVQDVRLIHEPLCTICGRPFDKAAGNSHRCGYCLGNCWYFKRARAVVRYQPPIAQAVKSFKYNGRMHALATFAALTQQYFLEHPRPQPDVILPVPLHPKRLRRRGFNQALLLGRRFFPQDRNIIDPHILERKTWTRPQAGLSGSERRRNVRNAFRLRQPEKIKNKKILLVDDVFTTGATVNECARILVKNQAAEVEVFTIARAMDGL
jgi:ComF family protein